MFRRLLIANRGEIARRIARTAKRMGVETVAVFSTADRNAPFVSEADHAVCIGPARALESYLDPDAILQAALQTGAQAIHPGYGFLSENAAFAERVRQLRLGWVGPSARVIRQMGEKSPAKAAMRAAGLALIPGSNGLLANKAEAVALAKQIGYPVLLKADAGGGGRGLRRADDEAALGKAWDEAQNEARAAFGNDALYLEKYLVGARHIEFQILGDAYGNAVHLFERECSIQRRHQKLLEEAPSAALTEAERTREGQRAAAAAAAIGYSGAGTMEFLFEVETRALYFIEMNTRLQVEHPVTEAITGLDLVEAQLRIACGERLWFRQEDVQRKGHAIELRLNAEDPAADFKPSPGTVHTLRFPTLDGPDGRLRVDAALIEGSEVSPYYDSLIAKLIAWAPDRAGAIALAERALGEMQIEGVATTAALHRAILAADDFRAGHLSVGQIPGWPPTTPNRGS